MEDSVYSWQKGRKRRNRKKNSTAGVDVAYWSVPSNGRLMHAEQVDNSPLPEDLIGLFNGDQVDRRQETAHHQEYCVLEKWGYSIRCLEIVCSLYCRHTKVQIEKH